VMRRHSALGHRTGNGCESHQPFATAMVIAFSLLPWFASAAPRATITPPDDHHIIGYINPDEIPQYQVDTYFGIEQWEAGQRTAFRIQQWWFWCRYPEFPSAKPTTGCGLSRVVIDRPAGLDGVVISQYQHDLSDGTLRMRKADWVGGRLDLQLMHQDKTTTEIWIDLAYHDKRIYLKSFRALRTLRAMVSGEGVTIEYRIPKYTYILDVPVEMRGLKPKEFKEGPP
jgi:hypothetical protein